MPIIEPFRAIRYDLGHVGSLSNVIAPPYDVIGPDLQDSLYKKHPANVVRLILNREEPGDDSTENRYARAARFLRNWQREGVLFTEADPALYVYHQEFTTGGETHIRRGFMGRCRLERFGEGTIYPHEETLAGPKQDRLLLTRACRANLSQIFGLYPDPAAQVQSRLEAAVAEQTPLVATDHLGVVHRMWPVADISLIGQIASLVADKPVFIADGHHRYETACNYRDELLSGGELPSQHPANSVLMMLIGMSDPGLLVLPTHRLFRGLPELTSADLIARLGDSFAPRLAGEGSDLATTIWDDMEMEGEQGTLALYTAADERWTVARITPAGRTRMAQVSSEHSQAWQGLGVAILHRLVIETLLDAKHLPKPDYVHLVEEVIRSADSGEFQLSALVMPATVDHIRSISETQERMPAKSTYFYPKLLSGLVINPLE